MNCPFAAPSLWHFPKLQTQRRHHQSAAPSSPLGSMPVENQTHAVTPLVESAPRDQNSEARGPIRRLGQACGRIGDSITLVLLIRPVMATAEWSVWQVMYLVTSRVFLLQAWLSFCAPFIPLALVIPLGPIPIVATNPSRQLLKAMNAFARGSISRRFSKTIRQTLIIHMRPVSPPIATPSTGYLTTPAPRHHDITY